MYFGDELAYVLVLKHKLIHAELAIINKEAVVKELWLSKHLAYLFILIHTLQRHTDRESGPLTSVKNVRGLVAF